MCTGDGEKKVLKDFQSQTIGDELVGVTIVHCVEDIIATVYVLTFLLVN